MAKCKFYYDETEHSRSLTLSTVTADEFYDGFVVVVVGWDENCEAELERKYLAFEERYRSPGAVELKSTALAKKQFRYGFRSLTKANVRLVRDFLDLFDDGMFVYCSFSSKVEHLVYRLFDRYRNVPGVNTDFMKYTLAKLVVQYRPREIVEAFYGDPEKLIRELRAFLLDRIERNKANPALKRTETEQCQALLAVLGDASALKSAEWEYYSPLEGFALYLSEHEEINDYELNIDQEERTAAAARELGFDPVFQVDSKDCFGIRMADMFAGIAGKLLKAIRAELTYRSKDDELKKNLFDEKWFELDNARLELYKQLRRVLMLFDSCWYKTYGGVYSDDLVALISLLNYLGNFEDADTLRANLDIHAEAFNACCCTDLALHFDKLKTEVPWKDAPNANSENLFRPRLRLADEPIVHNVVKVMFAEDGAPMAVVRESGKDTAYVLPDDLVGWVSMLVSNEGLADLVLPCDVRLQIVNGRCCADIL